MNSPTETIGGNTYYQMDNVISNSQQTYTASIPGNTTVGQLTRRFVVTTANTPTVIPGGLWDMNIFASDNATAGLNMYYVMKVTDSLGVLVSTIGTSNIVAITGTVVNEYILSLYVPTTTIDTGNRVVIEVYVTNTNGTAHTINYYWGSSVTPSHVHTSISIAIQGATGATGLGGALGNYGVFLNTENQTFANNTTTAFVYNSVPENNGVTLGSPASRIYIGQTGTYNFQFSAQLFAGSGQSHLNIWYRINGADIPESNTFVHLDNNQYAVAAWNFVQTVNAGQYFELVGRVNNTNAVTCQQINEITTTGPIPATPSMILTVSQVMYTQIGPSGPTGATGPIGPTGPTPTNIVSNNVSTTTVTLGSGGTFYNLTNSGFNTIVLPSGTPSEGTFWVLRNNTSSYISITTLTNTSTGIPNPLVIPPSNSVTLVWTNTGTTYILY